MIARVWSHLKLKLNSSFFPQTCLIGFSVEHLSGTQVAHQSVTKFIIVILMNLITPKAEDKLEQGTLTEGDGLIQLTSLQ